MCHDSFGLPEDCFVRTVMALSTTQMEALALLDILKFFRSRSSTPFRVNSNQSNLMQGISGEGEVVWEVNLLIKEAIAQRAFIWTLKGPITIEKQIRWQIRLQKSNPKKKVFTLIGSYIYIPYALWALVCPEFACNE